MFRYSRYFLILFFVLTVLPLALMFVFHHNHAENMHRQHEEHMFNMASGQLRNNLTTYSYSDFENIDLKRIFPAGPFKLELYSGNIISEESYKNSIIDPYIPFDIRVKEHNILGLPEDKNIRYEVIEIKDNNGNVKYSLLLRMLEHKPPFHLMDFGLIVLFVGVMSSLTLGLCLRNTFLVPLSKLSDALSKLQKGDYDSRLDSTSKQKELKKVFERFNNVVKSLKEKEELRTNFISNLTHDLRTPLIAQEKTLELISKEFENLGMEDTYHLSKSLEKNNKHLLRMVNLILEAYRFDANDLRLHFDDVNISEIIDDCFSQLEVLAKEKKIQLRNKIPKTLPLVNADRSCLNRVFINLVSNAIVNIPKNGEVNIDYNIANDYFEIIVQDNGNGILEQDLEYIFNRYYVGKGYERNIGSGLGLYVCKELISLHQGDISVESQKGEFTQFKIKLPINS